MSPLKLTWLLLLLTLGTLYAQERDLRLKISGSYVYVAPLVQLSQGWARHSNYFDMPQVALLLPVRKGHFHEIGLHHLSFTHPQSWRAQVLPERLFNLGLSYQYNLTTRDRWPRLKLYLGIGVSAEVGSRWESFLGLQAAQNTQNVTETSRWYQGMAGLRLTPGLMYDFSDRFFASLAVPTNWLRLTYSQSIQIMNTGETRSSQWRGFSWLPLRVPLEIGAGIRF